MSGVTALSRAYFSEQASCAYKGNGSPRDFEFHSTEQAQANQLIARSSFPDAGQSVLAMHSWAKPFFSPSVYVATAYLH